MKRSEIDREKLSPMMKQFLEIKDSYNDSIIFFRLGDFYEMFFEDAITASRELELTLTGKQAGLEEKVPMCGVPFKAYQPYLEKLVDKGYKVAIVEQMDDPKQSKDMVRRQVIQVVTKGTRLDTSIDAKTNNFIASIYDFDYCYAITYSDVSTGQVYACLLDNNKQELLRTLTRYNFTELIVNNKMDREIINHLRTDYHMSVSIYDEMYDAKDYEYIYKNLKDIRLISGVKHLLAYLLNTKKGDLTHLQEVVLEEAKDHLLLDNHTKRNLELTETIRLREKTYSLLWLLDKNKTAM